MQSKAQTSPVAKFLSLSVAFLIFGLGGHSAHAQEKTLYRFQGQIGPSGKDGGQPMGSLAVDAAGNLYGTTYSGGQFECAGGGNYGGYLCGTLFQISPPAAPGGAWKERILHNFTGNRYDGGLPSGGLIADSKGNLYGTTTRGGQHRTMGCWDGAGCGTVFEISPNGRGFTYQMIYSFRGSDGQGPIGNLAVDEAGNLYGMTYVSGGVVFQLAPPAVQGGAWSETVLRNFVFDNTIGNVVGLTLDKQGNLYGAARYGGAGAAGAVFELSRPSTAALPWNETILYSFTGGSDGAEPLAGLIFDKSGNLYGTTVQGGDPACNCGVVFKLAPPTEPGGTWAESVLYTFLGGSDGANPEATLLTDEAGDLYGTTSAGGGSSNCSQGCGTIFGLSQQGGSWVESTLYRFRGGYLSRLANPQDGAEPMAGLIRSNGKLYGTAASGGFEQCDNGRGQVNGFTCGTVFELDPAFSVAAENGR
jgi:uncharacterized repeat protein (TIGR03803 family)